MAFVDDDGKPQITPAFSAAGKKAANDRLDSRVQVGWHQLMRGSFSLGVWGEMLDPASEVKGGSTMRENCVWLGIGDTRRATFQGRIKSPAKGEAGNCAA